MVAVTMRVELRILREGNETKTVTILDFRRADFIQCMDFSEEFHRILSVFKYHIFHT